MCSRNSSLQFLAFSVITLFGFISSQAVGSKDLFRCRQSCYQKVCIWCLGVGRFKLHDIKRHVLGFKGLHGYALRYKRQQTAILTFAHSYACHFVCCQPSFLVHLYGCMYIHIIMAMQKDYDLHVTFSGKFKFVVLGIATFKCGIKCIFVDCWILVSSGSIYRR